MHLSFIYQIVRIVIDSNFECTILPFLKINTFNNDRQKYTYINSNIWWFWIFNIIYFGSSLKLSFNVTFFYQCSTLNLAWGDK